MKCLLILLTFFLTQEAFTSEKKRPTAAGEPGSKKKKPCLTSTTLSSQGSAAAARETIASIDLDSWDKVEGSSYYIEVYNTNFEVQSFANPNFSKRMNFKKNPTKETSFLAGQDYLIQDNSFGNEGEIFLGIFDGHGAKGESFSIYCGEYINEQFTQHRDELAAYIISKENSAVDDMITSWFREAHYRSITLGGKGGTTATIICLELETSLYSSSILI